MAPNQPNADVTARDALRLPYDFVQPSTDAERLVCDIFSDIMKVVPVGLDDDFYDLGGDSLMGEQISLMLQEKTGQDFAVSAIFEYPSPRLIAEYLSAGKKELVANSHPIFVVHGKGGYTAPRPEFYAGLKQGTKLVMFEFPGIRSRTAYPDDIPGVAAAYVDQIMHDYPEGPVLLSAFCAGGLIAIEMMSQLEAAGRDVPGLVLLDPSAPKRVQKRHALQSKVEQGTASLLERTKFRLIYSPVTGASALDHARDTVENSFRVLSCLINEAWIARLKKRGPFWKHRDVGLRNLPRARLIVAYRFAWPAPYAGKVTILASKQRAKTLSSDRSVWERFLPNRSIEIMSETHGDIGKANAGIVAERMEHILLEPLSQAAPKADVA
ncbi:phosphopantetheine-binding protein [Celeribacter sp. PS-C1]|uniref:thioesterase domain-containing protein n=1 Tax=Celeribacter sp. PS-C1 TaxID=2820813 RepID=UPI001C9344B3|nr:phosphopantetheine-binding protein [Celeribacter sp. PS-C1]MBW6419750.1 hypothetical protein [Celeribacter sp. PS-C1]